MPVLANLLSTVDVEMVVVTHSATILTKLAGARGFPEEVQKHSVYAALVCAVINTEPYDVLTEVLYDSFRNQIHSCLVNLAVDFMSL